MIHCLTEQLTGSRGRFNKLVLTYTPNIIGGNYCTSYINDSNIVDMYNDLRSDYPDTETPKEDLQIVIDYCLSNGRFFNEDGEEIEEWEFFD